MIFSGGGGSNPLNFKVTGGTAAPANPRENTIWVNTDVAISSWVFSATQPASATNGMVWIVTGTSGLSGFNALKKNTMVIIPISAKQYIGGAWVDKTAKSYQNGEWVDWVSYFFKDGDQCTELTGGWVTAIYDSDATRISATKTISGNVMQFVTDGDAWRVGTLKTKNEVNLTPHKTLYFKVTYDLYDHGEAVHKVGVFSSGETLLASTVVTKDTAGTYSVDVSGISGAYCIGIYIMNRGNDSINKIYVTEIWAE